MGSRSWVLRTAMPCYEAPWKDACMVLQTQAVTKPMIVVCDLAKTIVVAISTCKALQLAWMLL